MTRPKYTPAVPRERGELEILLHEHALARADERHSFTVIVGLMSVTIAVLVGATTAVVISDVGGREVSDWVWGAAPLLPIGILAVFAAVGSATGLRAANLLDLEQRIQALSRGSEPRLRLGYTLVRPRGLALVAWFVADAAGVGLLSLLTGYFISQIAEPTLKGALSVAYGLTWLILMVVLIRGFYFGEQIWRRVREDTPARAQTS